MASKITINLDASKDKYLFVKCKQNDDLVLEANIYENGEALNLTNKVVTIQGLKANNTYIIQNTQITKDNNKITVNLDRDFTRVSGTTKIEVVLVESGKQNTTFSFYLEVVNSVIKGAVESSNTVTILEALENKIVEAGAVKEETEELIQNGGAATKGDIQEVNSQLEQKIDDIDLSLTDISINPAYCTGATDSEKIEKAIELATTLGKRTVMIPEKSPINGNNWIIDRAILLPSNFTLILNNCTIKLKTGVKDNIITNSGARGTLTSNQNINIIGTGNATLHGGDVSNFVIPGEGYNDYRRVSLLLFNTQGFNIKNIKIKNSQGWSISIENNCSNGVIKNIEMDSQNTWANQDGVDIRKGCHDILIENIYGSTGDDMVALTGLYYEDTYGNSMQVGGNALWGTSDDIYNITIKNIRARYTGNHTMVRLLVQNTIKIYDINIDGVYDISEKFDDKKHGNAILLGDTDYYQFAPDVTKRVVATPDDMFNIKISNVISRASNTITIRGQCRDIEINNVSSQWDVVTGINLITKGAVQRLNVDNFKFYRHQSASFGGAFFDNSNWVGDVVSIASECNLSESKITNLKVTTARNVIKLNSMISSAVLNLELSDCLISNLSHKVVEDSTVVNDINNKVIFYNNLRCPTFDKIYVSDPNKLGKIMTNEKIQVILFNNTVPLRAVDNLDKLRTPSVLKKDIRDVLSYTGLIPIPEFNNYYCFNESSKVDISFRFRISGTTDDISISNAGTLLFTFQNINCYKPLKNESGIIYGVKTNGNIVPIFYVLISSTATIRLYAMNGAVDTFKEIGGNISYYNSMS